MSALFAADECGPMRPSPVAPPSRAQRDQATLDAGTHPATGRPLRETPAGEAAKSCRQCVACGYTPAENSNALRLVCGITSENARTRLSWPACDLFIAEPVLEGQLEIPGGA